MIPADDPRTYEDVSADVEGRRRLTKLQHVELEPEESYDNAAANTRQVIARPTLGLGRDMRLFELCSFGAPKATNPMESVVNIFPKLASRPVILSESNGVDLSYSLTVSRGIGCSLPLTRRLEDGSLPILHQRVVDEDVVYELTFFCSLENAPLVPNAVRGTHFLVADGHSGGHHFTPEHEKEFLRLMAQETSRSAEEAWNQMCLSWIRDGSGRNPKKILDK